MLGGWGGGGGVSAAPGSGSVIQAVWENIPAQPPAYVGTEGFHFALNLFNHSVSKGASGKEFEPPDHAGILNTRSLLMSPLASAVRSSSWSARGFWKNKHSEQTQGSHHGAQTVLTTHSIVSVGFWWRKNFLTAIPPGTGTLTPHQSQPDQGWGQGDRHTQRGHRPSNGVDPPCPSLHTPGGCTAESRTPFCPTPAHSPGMPSLTQFSSHQAPLPGGPTSPEGENFQAH